MRSKRISTILACSALAMCSIACFANPGGGGGAAAAKPKKSDRIPQLAEDVLVWRRDGWLDKDNTTKNFGFRAGKVVNSVIGQVVNVKVTLDLNDHSNLNSTEYSSVPVFPTGTDAERKKRSETYAAWAEFVPRPDAEEPE